MSTFVTVKTTASASVLIPFSTSAVAALAQAALDDPDTGVNPLAGVVRFFSPTVAGAVTQPTVGAILGVAQTNNFSNIYGLLDSKTQIMVNGAVTSPTSTGGTGTAIAVGAAATNFFSGQNATSVFLNVNPAANVFLGGGRTVLQNAFSFATMNIVMDGGGSVLGGSTLILDDQIGGGATVNAFGNDLIALQSGGADMVIGNSGTNVVLASAGSGTAHGTATISSTGAGNTLWVGAQGAPLFVTPNGGDAFLFNGTGGGSEVSATLFGGTKVIGGQTLTAGVNTGRVTAAGMNGYLEAGSAGGSVLQSGTTAGAATLVAGGAGDILLGQAAGNTLNLANGTGVTAASFGVGAVTFRFGGGSGQALGLGGNAGNQFLFEGAGNYTITGGHGAGFAGSLYRDVATSGGAGNITILDFIAQPVASTVAGSTFDRFDLNGRTVSSLTNVDIGNGAQFDATAVLSDGTTIFFDNALNQVKQVGTFLQ